MTFDMMEEKLHGWHVSDYKLYFGKDGIVMTKCILRKKTGGYVPDPCNDAIIVAVYVDIMQCVKC